ncbi:MAG: hypothetical protein P1R58_09125 [bacterium]|nr:hypothetical protein [bacterium]
MNLPDYNFISVPLWLLNVLHILTLTLHLAAMNFMFGGIIVILLGKIDDRWNNPAVQKLVRLFPSAMAATVTLGVAPLLFVQMVFPGQVYSASIVSGWFWLAIVGVAIVLYYFLYGAAFAKQLGRQAVYLSLAFAGLLYISFIYSSTFAMAENPALIKMLYAAGQSGWIVNPDVGSYLFRWLHMIFGAVTVGAFFVGWIGKESAQVYKAGKSFYLWGMVSAMVLGFIYLVTFGDYILPFMRSPGIWWMTASLILSLGSLHFFFKQKFLFSGTMLFVSLLGMVATRHYARLVHLSDFFRPEELTVKPDYGPFLVFLVSFVIMLGFVWYMFRLFFKSPSK